MRIPLLLPFVAFVTWCLWDWSVLWGSWLGIFFSCLDTTFLNRFLLIRNAILYVKLTCTQHPVSGLYSVLMLFVHFWVLFYSSRQEKSVIFSSLKFLLHLNFQMLLLFRFWLKLQWLGGRSWWFCNTGPPFSRFLPRLRLIVFCLLVKL